MRACWWRKFSQAPWNRGYLVQIVDADSIFVAMESGAIVTVNVNDIRMVTPENEGKSP